MGMDCTVVQDALGRPSPCFEVAGGVLMPLPRHVAKAFCVTLLALSMAVAASAQSIAEKQVDKDDAIKQRAIAQLRAIAEAVEKCPAGDESTSEFSMVTGRAEDGAFQRRVSAPINVTWDIEQRPSSIRSPETGFIEFTTNGSCNSSLSTIPHCKQKDELCWGLYRSDSDTAKARSEYCENLKPNPFVAEVTSCGRQFHSRSRSIIATHPMPKISLIPARRNRTLWFVLALSQTLSTKDLALVISAKLFEYSLGYEDEIGL